MIGKPIHTALLVKGALTLGIITALFLGGLVALYDQETLLRHTIFGIVGDVRTAADRILDDFYVGTVPDQPLPHYAITLDVEEYQEAIAALPTQRPSFLIEDAKVWIDAELTYDGVVYPLKMRVRGLGHNHWIDPKKSWRLKFPNNGLFRGMKQVSVILPYDREWTAEPLNVYRAQKLGLLHPPTRFVTISFNGSAPLMYMEMEHWTKEMLEKAGASGDVNLYHPDPLTSIDTSDYDVFRSPTRWEKYEQAPLPTHDSFEEIALLQSFATPDAHKDPLFAERVDVLFDIDEISAWYVVSMLSGNHHAHNGNLRFYFDQTTGRFVMMPWDISVSHGDPDVATVKGNDLWQQIFSIPRWKEHADRMLAAYVHDNDQWEDDMAFLRRTRQAIERAAYRDRAKFVSNRDVHRMLRFVEERMQSIFDALRDSPLLSIYP